MYAIRSYYASFTSKRASTVIKRGSQVSACVRIFSVPCATSHLTASVITSYSIHYTKLYDLEVKEELKEIVEIQVVAFPQDGIYASKDGDKLMEKAVEMGADVVGGIPHNELTREDGVRDVEFAFELAQKYDRLIDIHCDETGDDQSRFIEVMANVITSYSIHYTKLYDA